MDALIFLLKLAWDSRVRLPLLITVGFMILDIRMQLDINVETRRVPRFPEEENDEEDGGTEVNTTSSSNESYVTA